MQQNNLMERLRPSVKLELTFTAQEWESLTEFSNSQNDKTVSETVMFLVYQNMKVFLAGKHVGMKDMGESIVKKLREPR